MKASDLDSVQNEHWTWAVQNFGASKSWRSVMEPVMGITEELGELVEAHHVRCNLHQVKDAFGDTLIYMLDLCSRLDVRISDLWQESVPTPGASVNEQFYAHLLIQVGRLNHACLKSVQEIRRNEDHMANAQEAATALLGLLRAFSFSSGIDLWGDCLSPTWENIVKKRDWRPERGETTS